MTTPVWIGLGSNLGDRRGILDAAVSALAGAPGVTVDAVSSYHETLPVGGPPGQGPFLNAAAALRTSLDPHRLLTVLQRIEAEAGRVREVRWGGRTLDLDILMFGTRFLNATDLKLPHPRLALRRFVLEPLAEIAPGITDTMTRRTIADLLANLDQKPRLLALDGRPGPWKSTVFRRVVERLPALAVEDEADGSDRTPAETALERSIRANDQFARRIRSLDSARWAAEGPAEPWIAADFYLDPRSIRVSATERPEMFADGPANEWVDQAVADDRWRELNRWAFEHIVSPILVVDLPGAPGEAQRPGDRSVPTLRPDPTDLEGIVHEIVATCRSIEGN